eukprot:9588268-Lingulodinium_polyedra.AAC.1
MTGSLLASGARNGSGYRTSLRYCARKRWTLNGGPPGASRQAAAWARRRAQKTAGPCPWRA